MSHRIRVFVGIALPPELQTAVKRLIARLQASGARVRWAKEDQLHWTLRFLGEVEMLETDAICRAVQRAALEVPPFDVEVFGAGAFPNLDNPRTLWLGVRQGFEPMQQLHLAIDRELKLLGYGDDAKRFLPHLTIGRLRSDRTGVEELARLIQQEAEFDGGLSTLYEVTIFSSQLERGGPVYEPLGHADLGGE